MTYNTQNLRLGQSEYDKTRRLVVEKLFKVADIVCLQETWLAKQDLAGLNSLNRNFHGIGESTTDLNDKHLRGRIPGGVAILWNTRHEHVISELRLNVDWAVGILIKVRDRLLAIINVYMPYEKYRNEREYINRLAFIKSYIDELPTTCVYVVGDLNSNISNARSLFSRHLQDFCTESELILSSKELLPDTSFTYTSDFHRSTSWLDHIISTSDAHESIRSMSILHRYVMRDHSPVMVELNLNRIPEISSDCNTTNIGKLDWTKLSNENITEYQSKTQELLDRIELPRDAITCRNVNCADDTHKHALTAMYDRIVGALYTSGESMTQRNNRRGNGRPGRPGWNEHVEAFHQVAIEANALWVAAGKPRNGDVFRYKWSSRLRFKYALRYIKDNENAMRADSLARKMQSLNSKDFWKEVSSINSSKTPLPTNINGTTGQDKIVELWRKHYHDLFNCLQRNVFRIDNVEFTESIVVRPDEITAALKKLGDNKSSGLDSISAEHLKNASNRLIPLLAMCITGLLVHGILPDSMISVLLVPVIKDKTGKISSKDNYRPIALASILSKVLEIILLSRLEVYLTTNDNQFGFKKEHGTDMCIFALKEVIDKYQSLNSSMMLCFLDASKAFDRINHEKLFRKMVDRGVPMYLVRILVFWYANQTMKVRWGSAVSNPFNVSNGVRQGGILSPFLFNLYMDDLSNQLNECQTGCMMGTSLLNHLMYADDLVIFSPYSAGMQRLLQICSDYGVNNDIKFNPIKSNMMIIRSRDNRDLNFPEFRLSGEILQVCRETKYLGHYFTDDLKDDKDIARQRRKLYGQGNMLMRKFHMCTPDVKVSLFRAYCTPLYTPHLWCNYSRHSIRKLTVAYNDAMRLTLRVPRHFSASQMFAELRVPACQGVIRNLMFKFIKRIEKSNNDIIMNLVDPNRSSARYTSRLWKHWYRSLYVNGMN